MKKNKLFIGLSIPTMPLLVSQIISCSSSNSIDNIQNLLDDKYISSTLPYYESKIYDSKELVNILQTYYEPYILVKNSVCDLSKLNLKLSCDDSLNIKNEINKKLSLATREDILNQSSNFSRYFKIKTLNNDEIDQNWTAELSEYQPLINPFLNTFSVFLNVFYKKQFITMIEVPINDVINRNSKNYFSNIDELLTFELPNNFVDSSVYNDDYYINLSWFQFYTKCVFKNVANINNNLSVKKYSNFPKSILPPILLDVNSFLKQFLFEQIPTFTFWNEHESSSNERLQILVNNWLLSNSFESFLDDYYKSWNDYIYCKNDCFTNFEYRKYQWSNYWFQNSESIIRKIAYSFF